MEATLAEEMGRFFFGDLIPNKFALIGTQHKLSQAAPLLIDLDNFDHAINESEFSMRED